MSKELLLKKIDDRYGKEEEEDDDDDDAEDSERREVRLRVRGGHGIDNYDGNGRGVAASAETVKVRIQNLCRTVEDTGAVILRDVSLDVSAGSVVGIMGPSGSGKSTLLRALNRLSEPPPSSVFLDGVDITTLDVLSLRRRVGMLFQLPALFDGTVADNVRYGPSLVGIKLEDSRVEELLRIADLEPSFASKAVGTLSVGQAQRVALARTLANNPEVLLLDEPTSALDPLSTSNIEDAVTNLSKNGLTVIIVSHSIKQIQKIASIVCVLVNGEVVEISKPSELGNSNHPVIRQFIEAS